MQTLLDRPPRGISQSIIFCTDRRGAGVPDEPGREVVYCGRSRWTAAPRMARALREKPVDVVHVWGADALARCASALAGRRSIVWCDEPGAAREVARWILQVTPRPVAAANSQTVRRALVEAGVPFEQTVVIRDPIDFGQINRARQAAIRRAMFGDAWPVMLLPGPARHAAGHLTGFWSAAILCHLFPNARMILPFDLRETRRLARLARGVHLEQALATPNNLGWAELVTCADVLIATPTREMAAGPIAWAMAGGVAVVAVARRSVTELIADRHNGLLTKSASPHAIASAALQIIEDNDLRRRLTDTARGQAFEVFGVRNFVDAWAGVYANVAAGRAAAEGVRDTAMAS